MSNQAQQGSSSFLGLLFLVFLILKLTHVINWSWWWITAPLWGMFAILFTISFVVFFIAAIMGQLKK